MVAGDFVDECEECRESGGILGQICARGIVDPEKTLAAVEDVARLAIEFCVGAGLEPGGIVEMCAHELQREDTHANREQQQCQDGDDFHVLFDRITGFQDLHVNPVNHAHPIILSNC